MGKCYNIHSNSVNIGKHNNVKGEIGMDKKKMRDFLYGAGMAAAGVATVSAVSYLVTKKLMSVAMDRDGVKPSPYSDKVRNHLCGFNNEDGFLDKMDEEADRLAAMDMEVVEITGHDGTKLKGHLYTCEYPKRLIIAVHGWRSTWNRDFGMAADFWFENNCNVLFIEQRSQGESDGEYIGFGLLERYDCREWAKWAHEKYEGKLPVYLEGVSMGATTVLMAAGLDLPASVHGIISDSGFTSPRAIWKHIMENHIHLSYGPMKNTTDRICRSKIQMGSEDYTTVEALKNNKIPVFFAHGTDDPFVPVEMTYENYMACVAPKRLLIVPGAAHGMSFYIEKEKYAKELISFWNEFDK